MTDRRHLIVWQAMERLAVADGMKIIKKEKSPLMWIAYYVTFMFLWNRTFMTSYTTTGLGKIWMPERFIGTDTGWRTLAHELVHRRSAKRMGTVMHAIAYMWPQVVAPLGLFGLFGLLYSPLYGLLAVLLVFLPPLIPAIGRVREEVPAYAMSTAVLIADLESAGLVMDTEKVRHDEAVARARTLLGNGYFWPALLLGKKFEEDVARDIQVLSKLIPTSDDEIFRAVRTALQNAS